MTPRRTRARLAIAASLLGGDSRAQWGYELSQQAGVGPGSMYPFLTELLDAGYLESDWEAERPDGRPPRRYYRVTDKGGRFLLDFVASAPAARAKPRRGMLGKPVTE